MVNSVNANDKDITNFIISFSQQFNQWVLFCFRLVLILISFFFTNTKNNGSLRQLYLFIYLFWLMEMEFTAKTPHSHGLVKINLSGFLVESYHVTSCAFPVLILLHLIFFLKSSFSAAPMLAYTHHTWYSYSSQ